MLVAQNARHHGDAREQRSRRQRFASSARPPSSARARTIHGSRWRSAIPRKAVRLAAARTLATLDDPAAAPALASGLASSDVELVGASARGLAASFRQLGQPECDALAVALVRVQADASAAPALVQIARAFAACDAADTEPTLRALLAAHEDAALAGLGRLARSRKKLQRATMVALLDRAAPSGQLRRAHRRLPRAPRTGAVDLGPRRARPWPDRGRRPWPPRASSRSSALVPASRSRPWPNRTTPRASRPCAPSRNKGAEPVFARVLGSLAHKPDEAPAAWAVSPRGATFAQVLGLAPAVVDSDALRSLLETTAGLDGVSSRLDGIRCDAATRIAKSAFDSAPMMHCAPEGSLRFELARLTALERSPFRGGRLPHFEALLQSAQVRVREAALAVLPAHPEALGAPWALAATVRALGSEHAGEVITALEVVAKLPDARTPDLAAAFHRGGHARMARRRRRAVRGLAHDRPGRSGSPGRRSWPARSRVTPRSRCDVWHVKSCKMHRPARPLTGVFPPAPDAGATITVQTTAGALVLHLDRGAAPTSVATITKLARAGFYDHVEMHRVVPGFVVQFGDPEADGYGGAGGILLHETSDNSFGPLRIGLAHAGFDTASSQLFVTTGPARHLDGDYTWIGTATGPWQDVVQGDLVTGVQIDPE